MIDLSSSFEIVCDYISKRPNLKYRAKIPNTVSYICENSPVASDSLRKKFDLSVDGLGTILSNVTMALQGSGNVKAFSDGGWYRREGNSIVVNPEFKKGWGGSASQ